MGVSFKVSKIGRRFQPKSLPTAVQEEQPEDDVIAPVSKKNTGSVEKLLGDILEHKGTAENSDCEVSFILSLFPDGYSVGKPTEDESTPNDPIYVPKSLLPYDRTSEMLFSAIESGKLPAGVLDDIPGKYVDGTLLCEVRDYRKCFPEGINVVSGGSPVVNKVSLKISLENLVMDIPALSDYGWTYGDMMEVESRILKAIQPKLCLDPTPQLDRLSQNHVPSTLNFDIRGTRRKRWMRIPDIAVSSSNVHGKKICLDRSHESLKLGESGTLAQQGNVSGNIFLQRSNSVASDGCIVPSSLVSHQPKYPIGVASHVMMRDQQPGSLLNALVASPGGQDVMIPFANNGDSSIHDKRGIQDGQPSPVTNKKARLVHTSSDGNLHNLGPQIENSQNSELNWKMQQQAMGKGVQYTSNGLQKYSQQMFEGGVNQEGGPMSFNIGQQGIRYNLKEEPVEMERLEKPDPELNIMDSQQQRLQQRMGHQFARSSFPQSAWSNLSQPFDNNTRKDDALQKRKLAQSPRVSTGGLPQSPLSSKSGDVSTGSVGPQYGAGVTSGLVLSQKEKSALPSISSASAGAGIGVGGNLSFNTNANDSMQQQNLAQTASKRRSNSLQKTPVISGVGSPASVGNISAPINSPPIGTHPLGDPAMLERFSKMQIVSTRYQLHFRKNKVDEYPLRKPNSHCTQHLVSVFSNDSISEELNDKASKMLLSKSLVGGNMNVCKTRILNFEMNERVTQGVMLIMSEKESDDSVAFHMGDIEIADYVTAEDYLPTLPNTHSADLLAAQYCSLMEHEGYESSDHVQPKQGRNATQDTHLDGTGVSSSSEMHQFSEGVSLQTSNDTSKASNSTNPPLSSSQNVQALRTQMQMSQGLLTGFPQMLPQQLQQAQFQRNPNMLPANSVQHLGNMSQNANMQLNPHMTTKPSPLQLQMLQQQQQQQPQLLQAQAQSAMQRKMMSSLGNVGMSGNNMMGIGGLGRGNSISAPMGSISSIGNLMNQNPLSLSSASSLSNAIRAGTITQAQANFMKMRMAQNRAVFGNTQSSNGGILGARQMNQHPGTSGVSMLGSALNRANMNQIQRAAAMSQMGAPKLIPGMNVYMNQQQIQQQLQLQQLMQQQRQLQQSQETSVSLQDAVSSPQIGSPSSIVVSQQQQQQANSQQMSQRTPMSPQISTGAVHTMVASNAEACPASPQLSSQTFGSVGSISNSPMDLQGVNKSNSLNNAQ